MRTPLNAYMCVFLLAAMEELVCELRLFLDLLDREYLSAGVRERKMHLSNILHRVLSEKGEITRLVTTHTLAEAIYCHHGDCILCHQACFSAGIIQLKISVTY